MFLREKGVLIFCLQYLSNPDERPQARMAYDICGWKIEKYAVLISWRNTVWQISSYIHTFRYLFRNTIKTGFCTLYQELHSEPCLSRTFFTVINPMQSICEKSLSSLCLGNMEPLFETNKLISEYEWNIISKKWSLIDRLYNLMK